MRTLMTTHFVSLDGVAEAPGGEPGYRHAGLTCRLFPDDAEDKVKLSLVSSQTFANGVQYQVFRPAV